MALRANCKKYSKNGYCAWINIPSKYLNDVIYIYLFNKTTNEYWYFYIPKYDPLLPKNFTIKKPNILNISICVNEKSASSYYLHDVLNKKKYDFSKYLLFYGKLSFDVLFDVCKLPSGPNIPVSSFFTPSPIHIGSLTSATVLTKTTLIDARIGQGKYRNELMRLYGKKCMVTKINNTDFLIASHIKPWVDSDNVEKVDKYNGFLLSVQYDKLFDKGYISFEDTGKIKISKCLSKKMRLVFNVNSSIKIKLLKNSCKYLKFHRENVFKK